jgi:tetratricopeptide (TPR) repeat protein
MPRRAPVQAPSWAWARPAVAVGLALLALAAYADSFSVPFIFDDEYAIVDNPNLGREAWLAWQAPPQSAAAGRPVVGLSLAINYALGKLNVTGYHVFNLAVHVAAGWLLWGLLRRTLERPPLAARLGAAGPWLAAVIAAVWLVHPLQTEAVTYVVQRSELLVGLFYLATLYCSARSWQSPHAGRWQAAGVACCALGMASKEVMVSAPLLVLLYDRVFWAASWRELWDRRKRFYCGLAATWLILVVLMAGGPRNRSVGFDLGFSGWQYFLLQGWAIGHYLRLVFWPVGLCLDYGRQSIQMVSAGRILPGGLVVLVLLGLTLWALWRRPVWGFLGAWFFLILAPSSSFVPIITEVAAEKRMYLPLAAVVTAAVIGGWLLIQRLRLRAGRAGLGLAALIVAALAATTYARNLDYRTAVSIWTDTVAKNPGNAWAYQSLGKVDYDAGDYEAAIAAYRQALKLKPDMSAVYSDLGSALSQQGKSAEAIQANEKALELDPENFAAHNNLGVDFTRAGQAGPAAEHYEAALRIEPGYLRGQLNYGNFLLGQGRLNEAAEHLRAAIRIRPLAPPPHNSLAAVLSAQGHVAEAEAELRTALELDSRQAEAWDNLARLLLGQARAAADRDKLSAAAQCAERALQLAPRSSRFLSTAGMVLDSLGRQQAAIAHWQAALQADPNNAEARGNLQQATGVQASALPTGS